MIFYPAVAGLRFLTLLSQIDPTWVDALPSEVWHRWAAVLVAFPAIEDTTLRRKLLAKAYRAVPDVVLDTLKVVLDREGEHSFAIERMADCWNERLGQFMLAFVRRVEHKVPYWRERLVELIQHGVAGSRAYAASFLQSPVAAEGPERERALGAAHSLIVYERDAGWSLVWPLLREDPAFGREVILDVVFSLPILDKRSWGNALSESEAVDLVLWLEQQFPRGEDPKQRMSGRFEAVTRRQRAGELRNAVANNLRMRGTRESLAAIRRLSEALPELDWTIDLVWAERSMIQGTWQPRSPREILTIRPKPETVSAGATEPMFDSAIDDVAKTCHGGDLIVFAGAGVSMSGGLPSWRGLVDRLSDHLRAKDANTAALKMCSGLVQERKFIDALAVLEDALGESEFGTVVERHLDDSKQKDVPRLAEAIANLRPHLRGVVTTNLDGFLERAFRGEWHPLARATGNIAQRRGYILKLHGTLWDRDTWIFTRKSYDHAQYADVVLKTAFSALYHARTLLFVGYGMADDDFDQVLTQVRAQAGKMPPVHYALMAEGTIDEYRRMVLSKAGIRVIPYKNPDNTHSEALRFLQTLAAR